MHQRNLNSHFTPFFLLSLSKNLFVTKTGITPEHCIKKSLFYIDPSRFLFVSANIWRDNLGRFIYPSVSCTKYRAGWYHIKFQNMDYGSTGGLSWYRDTNGWGHLGLAYRTDQARSRSMDYSIGRYNCAFWLRGTGHWQELRKTALHCTA